MSKNNCCVVGCSNTPKKSPGTHFYTFPVLFHERERRRRWIAAVRRRREDGSPWEPTKNSRICSKHFINGKRSNDPRSPAYVPTIFPSVYGRTKHGTSKSYQRLQAREQKNKVDSITDAQALEDVMVDCTSEEEKISVDPAMQDQESPACLGFSRALQRDEESIKMEMPLATIGDDDLRRLARPCEKIGRRDTACQTEPEPLGGLVVLLSATDGSEASTQVSHVVQCDKVSHFMGSRSKKQVMNRYNQSLHPSMQRDRWTAQEDIMLLVAVKLYGDSSWTKVAQDMPWRTANAALTRYRRLCETLRSKQKTMADLERSLPAPVAPVNAARCARLKGVDKQLDLYRRTSRLLNTQTMKRAALMLVKGRDESLDREMCLRLYHKMLRLLQRNHAPRNLQMQGRLLNKAISQYAQPLHRPMVPNLAAYERQEWHAVANVLHDLHGLVRPPPNTEVEEVGTVPVIEEFFSKEVLGVPDAFQPNCGGLVLPLLPPSETTVATFGRLSDRFASGSVTESLSALQDGNSFPELSAALDADSIEDIHCTVCASRNLLELSSVAARASQDSCSRCNELRATRKKYEVLQARFISYFFWPAVLDTMNVAETVELPAETHKKRVKKYYKLTKIKKPWVKEKWKERKRLIAAAAAAVAGAAAEGVDAPEEDGNEGPSGTSIRVYLSALAVSRTETSPREVHLWLCHQTVTDWLNLNVLFQAQKCCLGNIKSDWG
ncbi:uncharacterized protein LOC119399602 isoform X3 [Rhipicephalus sanguineus]|uniref:uncharacterized protein LOC119399602 isoform X3 n=1 Tax=Rhipicephalus sanguineus TaxID=34632 RepID=UPI0020C24FAB|nr:uncharacterized protein LOC119399602 isoform X3 [Rhipicephalus sanguineus]